MKSIKYSPKELADLLGIPKAELTKKEAEGVLPKPKKERKTGNRYYTVDDLVNAREKLCIKLLPAADRARRQLFLNFKGGTGKSTIASSYAYYLAAMGLRVLAIDIDPQGHLTKCLGFDGAKCNFTLYNVLINRVPITEAMIKTPLSTLSLVPANLSLSPAELSLSSLHARDFRLKKALAEAEKDFDLVVLDAAPNLGLLNLNAILAADDILVPVLADFLSYHGLKILFESISSIEEDFGFSLSNVFVILNRYNPSINLCRESKSALEKHYGKYLLKTVIRQNAKIAEATSVGIPIFQYAPSCRAAQDIEALVKEIFSFY